MKNNFGKQGFGQLALVIAVGLVAVFLVGKQAFGPGAVEGANTGFDNNGYNNTARIFNGTGNSWCEAKGMGTGCLGPYSNDKLVMKWNAEWDRGNDEKWSKPPYNAWTDNEWNGKGVKDGSGAIWHYKIVWIGTCGADYTQLADGGYCIWGQFETIMDQGQDISYGPGHIWFTKANPAGYGAFYSKP